jgi:hypothetical protein
MKMDKDTNWECPKCNQPLLHQEQGHYCIPGSVSFYLDKCSPAIRKLINHLNEHLRSFGFYEIVTANTSLQYKTKSVFLTMRFKPLAVELEFQSRHEEAGIPTLHTVKIAKERFIHKTVVSDISDITPMLHKVLYHSYRINTDPIDS